jgi:hypothetical protein
LLQCRRFEFYPLKIINYRIWIVRKVSKSGTSAAVAQHSSNLLYLAGEKIVSKQAA